MNLQEQTNRIKQMMGVIKESVDLGDYLNVVPFYKLPYIYQKSLMIFRNEGVTNDDDIKELIDDELRSNSKRKMFYFGIVPIDLIKDEVVKRLDFNTFDEYHKWYGDEQTNHGDSVLPIIIDYDDEELIIDGWHRFHSYVRKGLNEIPVLGIYRD
jgi:hypothetical protein